MSWSYEEDERKSCAYLNHDPIINSKDTNIYKDVNEYLNNEKKRQYNEMKWVEYEYNYAPVEEKIQEPREEDVKEVVGELNENLIKDDKNYAYL